MYLSWNSDFSFVNSLYDKYGIELLAMVRPEPLCASTVQSVNLPVHLQSIS
jgi:hypothetical protein